MSGAGWPARYEVRVDGVLDGRWSEWFGGLRLSRDGEQTVLSGALPDQSALHGVLNAIGDLGHTAISVCRLPPEEPAAPA